MIVRVTTPSRLHFGLFSFGRTEGRQYGGVGMMVERPGLRLTIERADNTHAEGPLAERAVEFVRQVTERVEHSRAKTDYRIVIEASPPDHIGLGTGTQLGLAVAAGVLRLSKLELSPPDELARLAGRGGRSAVGTYGFLHGGLLMEAGKNPGDTISPLIDRVELPDAWRFVLIRPLEATGLSGEDEQQAFATLPPVPDSVTQELFAEAKQTLLPAATNKNYDAFSRSLGHYSRLAGECFAARQGGPYAGERAKRMIDLLRSLGVEGVGQSSWGPTLFALQPDQGAAERLAAKLQSLAEDPLNIVITPPANRGATIESR